MDIPKRWRKSFFGWFSLPNPHLEHTSAIGMSVDCSIPCKAPAAALDPLYSSWYCFHRDVHAADLEAELAVAAKLGMKTFIVDDGWQYEEGAPVGYPYCGDWRLAKGRFPDMAASPLPRHVQEQSRSACGGVSEGG